MDSEKKPGQELAKAQIKYETNYNPEFKDSPVASQALEQKAPAGPTTNPDPVTQNPTPSTHSVAAPPVTPAEPSSQAGPAIAAPPDESSEPDFSGFIERARQIIDRTKGDPHTQNREINELKIEFMKQHFNKDINPSGPV